MGRPNIEAISAGAAMVATSVGITARVLGQMGLLSAESSRIILGAAVIDNVHGLRFTVWGRAATLARCRAISSLFFCDSVSSNPESPLPKRIMKSTKTSFNESQRASLKGEST